MKKQFFFQIFCIVFLLSCQNNTNEDMENEPLANTIFIKLKNLSGDDLLNPNVNGTYNTSEIKIFYKKDGVFEEFYNPNLDFPRNFNIGINNNTGNYEMFISLNYYLNDQNPITLIKWNDTDTDTVKADYYPNGKNNILQKVWYNNLLKLDYSSNPNNGNTIEITK